MKIEQTQRGFDYTKFKDKYGNLCSLQKSSLATEDCIWLGIDNPKVDGRMHLSRDQVAELLPILQKFVETGELS